MPQKIIKISLASLNRKQGRSEKNRRTCLVCGDVADEKVSVCYVTKYHKKEGDTQSVHYFYSHYDGVMGCKLERTLE